MDVGEGLADTFCDALCKRAVSSSTDDFHWQKELGAGGGRIVDSGVGVGNTLLVIRLTYRH
jgi:hypothetical protein